MYIRICIYVYICMDMYVFMYAHVCVYIIYNNIYIYTYTASKNELETLHKRTGTERGGKTHPRAWSGWLGIAAGVWV